jgi:hypothetical protein
MTDDRPLQLSIGADDHFRYFVVGSKSFSQSLVLPKRNGQTLVLRTGKSATGVELGRFDFGLDSIFLCIGKLAVIV